MMVDSQHPNFPPSLSIAPNSFANQVHSTEGDSFGVEAQREAISRYGIAGRVWEAAYVLCAYVDPTDHDFDPPFRVADELLGVIELGSGTGIVAARIARAIRRDSLRPGGFVIATDLPDVCPLLRHNLAPESNATCSVRPLAWGNHAHAAAIVDQVGSGRVTHVVCSDLARVLVYFPQLLGPLLRTLIHLTSRMPSVRIVISYKIRSLSKETPFWTAFGLWFSFRPVLVRRRVRPENTSSEPWRQLGADESADRTFVFVAHRRAESIAWHVPESDEELIRGVGARGTTATKGDDTFETMLFMGMEIDDTGE